MSLREWIDGTDLFGVIDLVFGRQWGQRIVVIGAIVVYAWLALSDPATAQASAVSGVGTFVQMFTLILASLLIASAIETLLPRDALAGLIGDGAGARGVILSGLIGGLLPGGPYATYPIIRGVADRGASYPAMLMMLIGYSLIGLGRVPFGLAFFGIEIVIARVVIAVGATVVLSLLVYALAQTDIGGRVLSFEQ
ncbi:permease [Halorhabdus amylolytica]|uniref:permease n=1 Tax=Halorhabdus amylolytica TaxID=2559573 RepID=UPI0010AA6B17|nr:permease [Halorhabdus amylolytica]